MRSSKWRVLRHTATFDHIAMVVHQVPILGGIKQLARSCVLFLDVYGRVHLPEVEHYRFEQLVIEHCQTEILHVFVEFHFGHCFAARSTVEVLDYEDCLLDLLEDVLLIATPVLDVGMTLEVYELLYCSEGSAGLCATHLQP